MKRLVPYFLGGLALLGLTIVVLSFIPQQSSKTNFRTTDCKEVTALLTSPVPSALLLQLKQAEGKNHTDRFQNAAGDIFAPSTSTCVLRIPIVLYPARGTSALSSQLTRKGIVGLFEKTQAIWAQAAIVFDVEVTEVQLDPLTAGDLEKEKFQSLYRIVSLTDSALHIFFVRRLGRFNGLAISPSLALVADESMVSVYRVVAHEIGHLLGLKHNFESVTRLLFPGTNGMILTPTEIAAARASAILLQRTTTQATGY